MTRTSKMSTVNTHQIEFSLPTRTNQEDLREEETHHARPVEHMQVPDDTVSKSQHDTTKIGFLMLPREI
jgi:hypothetical protein